MVFEVIEAKATLYHSYSKMWNISKFPSPILPITFIGFHTTDILLNFISVLILKSLKHKNATARLSNNVVFHYLCFTQILPYVLLKQSQIAEILEYKITLVLIKMLSLVGNSIHATFVTYL